MPEIKLQHVVSFSSEDKNFPAENLLHGDGFKKWKSAKAGEKQISVTFQLEKATNIDKVDVGNDGSAFIEILVGKSSAGDDFQVLLVASAFMSPLDSRAGKNMTTVRMFTADKLSKNIVGQKWDRIKVVCTQPFNKTVPYGLAFVKFYSPPEEGSTTPNTPKILSKLGGFTLKSDEGDDIKVGSLFTSRDKEKMAPAPLTGAAAVRAASKLAEESQRSATPTTPKPATPSTPRDTSQVKRKHDNESSSSAKRQSIESRPHSESQKTPIRKQSTCSSTTSSSSSKPDRERHSSLKKMKSEPAKLLKDVPFDKIMKRVVFVMSGYQNPERGSIRDKAMEMGAQYKSDWGRGCTHLICAFEKTPKYSQVKGKGRIVGRKWITDSYKAKKLLPWRKYRVGRASSPPDGSDSDSDDGSPPVKAIPAKNTSPRKESTESKTSRLSKEEDADPYGGETDPESGSGDDTEDEIQRVRDAEKHQLQKKQSPHKPPAPKNDIYDASTDEEMENGAVNGVVATDDALPELLNLFQKRKFFFYGNFDQPERRKMLRFVVAYNGSVEEYMSESVSYVLTRSSWDDNFDKALSDNPSLAFIKPDWLYACDLQQKYVAFQRYSVIPA